jgi:hypothetical protein
MPKNMNRSKECPYCVYTDERGKNHDPLSNKQNAPYANVHKASHIAERQRIADWLSDYANEHGDEGLMEIAGAIEEGIHDERHPKM